MHPFFARLISWIAHPLLVPTYILLVLMSSDPFAFSARGVSDQRAMILLLSVFGTTFFIPGLGVALMKPLGLIKSLDMEDKQERTGPYIITGIFYLWLFKNLFSGSMAPELFSVFMLGATIGLFLAFFINIFSKISAHAVGMGGLVGMLLLSCIQWSGRGISFGGIQLSMVAVLALGLLVAGWTGMARLALKAHTPADLYRGYAVGFMAVLLADMLLG